MLLCVCRAELSVYTSSKSPSSRSSTVCVRACAPTFHLGLRWPGGRALPSQAAPEMGKCIPVAQRPWLHASHPRPHRLLRWRIPPCVLWEPGVMNNWV